MMGKYASYETLSQFEAEGIDYEIDARDRISGIAVIAPHGGGVEPGTDEIARAIAGDEHTFYCFKGIKPSGNSDLHLASTTFDEPRGAEIAKKAHIALAVHGCRGRDAVVHIGGLNQGLVHEIATSLTAAGIKSAQTRDRNLRGIHPDNICNRCQDGRGVQVEIPAALRKKMFDNLKHLTGKKKTEMFHTFVSAVRNAISIHRRLS